MNALDVTGIYAIEHTESKRVYIGSAVNFSSRWRIHRHHLNKGTHHSPHLQLAWSKYGENSFVFKKLVVCAKTDLLMYEQILVNGYRSADREHGFNAQKTVSSRLGMKASGETKEKIRAARAKQVFSVETRALWSANRTGRKMPDWFAEFTRQHRSGAKHTPQSKAKMSAWQKGSTHSLEIVERRSKITQQQADIIQARYAAGGVTQSELASEFLLSQSAVSLILSGKRWGKFSHIGV